jgi:hypothetical protein
LKRMAILIVVFGQKRMKGRGYYVIRVFWSELDYLTVQAP